MTRVVVLALLMTVTVLGAETVSVNSDKTQGVTFNKNVLPILQENCQVCHRPGGIAPMSLMTYQNARPWAKAIKAKVVSKQMPPWFADPRHGEFRNAPRITEANIKTLAAWADTGAPEGDAADKPVQTSQWTDGWRITPDVIVSMPEAYHVPASGAGEIREFFIDSPFKEDTWVTSIEIRPGDPSVVHHVIVQLRPPAAFSDIINLPGGRGRIPVVSQSEIVRETVPSDIQVDVVAKLDRLGSYFGGAGATFTTMEAVYAPGSPPLDFRYTNSAKLIPAGQRIRLEMHYTPNGKETFDKTMVGFTLARAPAQRRFVIMAPDNLANMTMDIPAGAGNYETRGELTFNQDVELVWFMPHMHLRGKDMSFKLTYPNGHGETLLKARFNFHWQLGYELATPIRVPKGSRLLVTAHHDNSRNNPNNPDPTQSVAWGDMTSQEMMIPWFGVIVDHDAQPDEIASYIPGSIVTGIELD